MTLSQRRNTLLRLRDSTGAMTVGVVLWVGLPLRARRVMMKRRRRRRQGLRLSTPHSLKVGTQGRE
jgi:hypothetical protein